MSGVPTFDRSEEGLAGDRIARLRWIWLAAGATAVAIDVAFLDAGTPLAPVAVALLVGILVNALAMRRPDAITAPLILDVALLGALVGASGGLANPFAALLPAPVFVGALSAEPRAARPVAAMVVAVTGLVAFAGGAPEPAAWLAISAMAGLGALVGLRCAAAAKARRAAAAALARERAANATGLAFAAAAHEIASPLATIRVAAAELARDAGIRPETREDALLIGREALRCGAILDAARGSSSSEGALPVTEIAARAASPHRERGVAVRIEADGTGPAPRIGHPEDAVLGLRNIIQNAVDFARSEVRVGIRWTGRSVDVTVSDDGDGFDSGILAGSPPGPGRPRPRGGPGTGQGLALARALLARGGGAIELVSAPREGARVRVSWARTGRHG